MSDKNDKLGTLIIENVDLELLDQDRVDARNILHQSTDILSLHAQSLENILNMLDHWAKIEWGRIHGVNNF